MLTREKQLPKTGSASGGAVGNRDTIALGEPLHPDLRPPGLQQSDSQLRRPRQREAALRPELKGPEWELVLRLVASRGFARSLLLTNFLLFVCQRALSGEAATINEQQIGVHVFGRKQEFNRSDDNIVRNYARMLRKRIDDYFLHEGRDEPLRIQVPRGGYVPVFSGPEHPSVEKPVAVPQPTTAEVNFAAKFPAMRPGAPWGLLWLAVPLLLLGVMAGFAAARTLASASSSPWSLHRNTADQLSHRLWRNLFAVDRETFIVPSDGGLVILHRFLERPTTLTDYISGTYRSPDEIAHGLHELTKTTGPSELEALRRKVGLLGDRRYTSMVDLDLASRLSRKREVAPERLSIRYARDLRMDDLRSSNAVLIGSVDANPWVELFQSQLNFQFLNGGAFGGSATILNRSPLPGEAHTYASITGDPTQDTYGVIAYVPNLGGSGHVVILEGINMAGTQAAGEFLLNAEQMQPILQRAMKANGEMRSFEVLVKTSNIAANASESKVISERIGQL